VTPAGGEDGRPRAYVASPLGFTAAGRDWYDRVYLPALRAVVEPVDPWALTTEQEVRAALAAGRQAQLWREVGARNIAAIRSSQLLIALLDGQELDSGTAAEVGYAAALGRTCFGLRTDLRQIGEDGSTVNLQVQAFIEGSGGRIVATLEELLAAVRSAPAA
jgi:nucleoside 2-deoxyribosyltransferase